MAWTLTNRGSSNGSYITSLAVGDTFTPTTGNIIVVAVASAAGDLVTSITGWTGTTFSKVGSTTNFSVWAAIVGSSPGSAQATVNNSASTTLQANVFEIAGTTETTVAAAFVQNPTVSSYNPSSPLSFPLLADFVSTTNLSFNIGVVQSAVASLTAETGYTKSTDSVIDDASYKYSMAGFYKASQDTTQALVGNGGIFGYRNVHGVAFEISEGSAGSVTVSVQESAHAQATDDVVVSQLHNLNVQPSGALQVTDDVNIQVKKEAAIQESFHLQVTTQPFLYVTSNFNVQDSAHLQVSDNVSLLVKKTAIVQESNHLQVASQPSISQVHAINVTSTIQLQVTDDIVLSVSGGLSVQGSDHLQISDQVFLSVKYNVASQDSNHLQVTEDVTIEQIALGDILVQDSNHLQASEDVSIDQVHNIIVQDATQLQIAENVSLIVNAIALGVLDSTHVAIADTLSLSQLHRLTAEDSYALQIANQIGITEKLSINLQDSYHIQTSDLIDWGVPPPFISSPLRTISRLKEGRVIPRNAEQRTLTK